MASQNVFDGDVIIRGRLRATQFTPPAGSVGNEAFDTGDPLDAVAQEHQLYPALKQTHGGAAVAQRECVHVAYGVGQVIAVEAGLSVACIGDSTTTIDVKKNGTSILSATIVLNNSNTAFTTEAGTITTDDYVAGDWLEVVVTVSAGTGTLGQGLRVQLVCREAAE